MAKDKRGNSEDKELSLKNEIFAIFSLFFSFFLIFSLASYTPLDPSFFHSAPARVITNFGGRLGSELSALLFNLFGFASLLFILIFFFLTAYFLFDRRVNRAVSKGIGVVILLLSLAALMANLKPQALVSGQQVQTGGMIGLLLNNLASSQIKGVFAALLFLSLIGVSLVLVAKISIKNIIVFLWGLLAKGGVLLGAFFHRRLEYRRRNRDRKKVQEKYEAGQGNFVFQGRQPLKEKEREPASRTEKRVVIKKPSKMPEDSGIFPEMEQEFLPDAQYKPPPLTYLDAPTEKSQIDIDELENKKQELSQRLREFKINGEIVEYTPGPVITTFEFVPDVGVKVKDVASLTEDLALVVKAQYVRIERILGKKAIGIEIPNKKRETIHLRELLETPAVQAVGLAADAGPGQDGQRRHLHFRPEGDAAPADRRHHGQRQERDHPLHHPQHPVQVFAQGREVHHDRSQAHRTGHLQHSAAPAYAGGGQPQAGQECTGLGRF